MRRRRAVRLAAAAVVLAALAVLVPWSPVYLPKLAGSMRLSGGHSPGYWVEALHSPEAETRCEAAYALGAMGAEEGVPGLASLLEDPDRSVRIEASLALSKMTRGAGAAVPALTRALADEEPFVRMNAALTLFRLRQEARPAVPALIRALDDEANRTNMGMFACTIQEMAVLALGRASAGSEEGVPALTAALNRGPVPRRVAAARALGDVGPAARSAVGPLEGLLEGLLEDDSKALRAAAAEALRNIGGQTARKGDGQAP
jgi:HEAT repeat protein